MKKFSTKIIARAGVIAALYVVFSLLTYPIAGGNIQFRLSECLTLLPLFFPEAAAGLFVGCMLSNLILGCAVYDILLGSVVTLLAAIGTLFSGRIIKNFALRIFVGGLFPVLLNAFLLPVIWYLAAGSLEYIYIVQAAFLIASQTLSVYVVGTPVCIFIERHKDKFFFN